MWPGRRDELEAAGPVRTFELADLARFTDWSATEQQHGTYKKARCRYLDPDTKEMIEAEATDGRITNGNELLVDERVETRGQAQKLTKGRLAKANEDWRKASLTVIGDPILVAGNVVALGSTFGGYAGRYLIHCARHAIKRASWTVKLELKGV